MNWEQLSSFTLVDIGKMLVGSQPGSPNHCWLMAELNRRQLFEQIEATKAQSEAAKAAADTAEYTRQNARYMLWSVIVLAASSAVSTIVTVALAFVHHT